LVVHASRPIFERLEVVETGRRRCWTEEEKLRIVAESLSGSRQGFFDGASARHLAVAADDVASAVSGIASAWRGSRVGVRAGGGPAGGPGRYPIGFIVDPDGDRRVAWPADYLRCRCRRGGTGAGSRSSVVAMIPVPSGVRMWIAADHTAMRCGMNSLTLRIQQALHRLEREINGQPAEDRLAARQQRVVPLIN
jgi:hypothetical protein